MLKRTSAIVAAILIIGAAMLLVEWDTSPEECSCLSETTSQSIEEYESLQYSPAPQPSSSPFPSISPTPTATSTPCPACPSPECPQPSNSCVPAPLESNFIPQEQSQIEQACDPQVSLDIPPELSMEVHVPERTSEQKTRLAEDETRFISNREVIWIHGVPFIAPPEVLRIDTYNLGPGKRSSIRVAHWNHPCNTWYNSKLNLASTFMNTEELDRWAVLIRPGSVAIDIGAHTGDTTVPIAVAADMTIAFEPMKTAYPVTWTNGIVNPLLNIHTHNLAVGTAEANLTWVYDCNGGADSIPDPNVSAFDVTMVVLPSFLKANYPEDVLKNISFIKIDTEGHDMDIVSTLGPLFEITTEKPIVFVEWYLEFEFNSDARMRFQTVAESLGFVIFSPSGERIYDMSSAAYCRDLVFMPKEKEEFWAAGGRMQPKSSPSVTPPPQSQ